MHRSVIVSGVGFALFSSPNANAVMGCVERRHYGIAAAALGTSRLTGQMLSLGAATLIIAMYVGPVQITPEYYPLFLAGIKTAFWVFAVLCLVGVFTSLVKGGKSDLAETGAEPV